MKEQKAVEINARLYSVPIRLLPIWLERERDREEMSLELSHHKTKSVVSFGL